MLAPRLPRGTEEYTRSRQAPRRLDVVVVVGGGGSFLLLRRRRRRSKATNDVEKQRRRHGFSKKREAKTNRYGSFGNLFSPCIARWQMFLSRKNGLNSRKRWSLAANEARRGSRLKTLRNFEGRKNQECFFSLSFFAPLASRWRGERVCSKSFHEARKMCLLSA